MERTHLTRDHLPVIDERTEGSRHESRHRSLFLKASWRVKYEQILDARCNETGRKLSAVGQSTDVVTMTGCDPKPLLFRKAVVLTHRVAKPCAGQADTRRLTAREGCGNHARSRTWRRAARGNPRSAVRPPKPGFADAVRQYKCIQGLERFTQARPDAVRTPARSCCAGCCRAHPSSQSPGSP